MTAAAAAAENEAQAGEASGGGGAEGAGREARGRERRASGAAGRVLPGAPRRERFTAWNLTEKLTPSDDVIAGLLRLPAVCACSWLPASADRATSFLGALATTMPPADSGAVHALAYRVVLRHAGVCVCVAWRDEASLDEHNQEMLFDVAGPHVARALRRCASAVQTLYVPYPADALPYGVCFPMLVDVIEHYDARYQFADPGGQRVTNALAALRCAPRLQHWLLLSSTITQSTNLVPVVLSNALREAVGAERAACRLRLRCCIPAVVDAMRGLLRSDWPLVHARFRADARHTISPGRRVLERLRNDLPPQRTRHRTILGLALLEDKQYTPACAYNGRQHDYISGRIYALHLAAARTATNITLLHQAVADGSLGAATVLLRAGADPLRPTDNDATGCGTSALALAAAEVSELLAYANRLPHDDAGLGSPLSRLAVRLAPARSAAPCAIAMLWLLGRTAAVRGHSDAAIAAAMPPAALAVLRAAPHAVPGLSLGGRVAPLGIARAARALLADAEAFASTGDEAAATRTFRARRARALAFAALGAAPAALLVALAVLALAVATTAPFAAFGLPAFALCLVGIVGCGLMLLAYGIFLAVEAILNWDALSAVVFGVSSAIAGFVFVFLTLFLYPVSWVAEFWCKACLQLISLASSLFAALSSC